tara:strand:- start:732 stop:1592 length:861 start_codon:yes stop_codon:yes gene_type:complete
MNNISQKSISKLFSGKSDKDENFPVSSFLISNQHKLHIKRFYNFARAADDVADNSDISGKEKIKIINFFDEALKKGNICNLDFIDELNKTLKEINKTSENPRKLLIAFKQDALKNRYKNWSELIRYCNYSASPVGRFVVDLHVHKSNKKLKDIYEGCDNLCNSLQILNHIQDCKKDFISMNRVYIPTEYFVKEEISLDCLKKNKSCKKFQKIKLKCLAKVDILLEDALKKISIIEDKRLKKETFVIFFIAKRLTNLLKISDPIQKKVKLSFIDLIFSFIKGIIKGI